MGADSGHCQFAYPGIKMANCVLLTRLRKQPLLLAPSRSSPLETFREDERIETSPATRSKAERLLSQASVRRANEEGAFLYGKFGRRKTQANKLNLKQKLLKLWRWLCVSSCLACIAFAVRPTQRIPAARTCYLYSINCITNTSVRGSRCRSGSKINTDRFPKAFRAAGLRHASPSGQFFR